MKVALGRLVLRTIGRAFEVSQPEPLCSHDGDPSWPDEAGVAAADNHSTNWHFAPVGLKAGWYMLEVEHSADSIGCVLTLLPIGSATAHLRLGSKKVCKRIVWFARRLGEFEISIDQPDCTLDRLTLIALSSSFAMNRIRQRLENRGSLFSVSGETAVDVYNLYQTNLHDSIFNKPYRYIDRDVDGAGGVNSGDGRAHTAVHLLLQRADSDATTLCHSVAQAMIFARRMGWLVDWQSDMDPKSKGGRSGIRTIYLMPVRSGVRYRTDVMHQLLSAAGEQTVIVYADHDHVDEDDQHSDPILKPDWNPELLLNYNYIDLPWIVSELWFDQIFAGIPVVERSGEALLLAAALGLCTSEDESGHGTAQFHGYGGNGAPGGVAALSNDQVRHVPEVLASVEMTKTPAKQDAEVRTDRWQQSVELAMRRSGSSAMVSCGILPGSSRVSWPLPSVPPAVDIIVPTRDNVEVLKKCLDSVLEKTQYPNFRIVVVDNDSGEDETEQYYRSLKTDKRVTLLRYKHPFNYSAINNFAIDHTSGPLLVLLNNDTEVISCHWLDELVGQALRPEVGCVGAKLYYANKRIQHAGVVVGITSVAGHAFRYAHGDDNGYCGRLKASQNYTAVTAACLAVRRETYLKVGGLDEEFLSVAWNDVDFCLKVQASGLRNVWTPYAELFHHEGLSRGSDDTAEKLQRVNAERGVMLERWSLSEYRDPAYHPLLTRDNENFGLGNTVT